MRIGHRMGDTLLSIGLPNHKAVLASRAVGRQTKVLQRLFHAVIPDSDFHDLARLVRGRHLAPEPLGISPRSPQPAGPS